MTVISPDLGHLRHVVDVALDAAIAHPDAVIELHIGKWEDASDGTTRD